MKDSHMNVLHKVLWRSQYFPGEVLCRFDLKRHVARGDGFLKV